MKLRKLLGTSIHHYKDKVYNSLSPSPSSVSMVHRHNPEFGSKQMEVSVREIEHSDVIGLVFEIRDEFVYRWVRG